MQSGKAKSSHWVLEFCPQGSGFIDPIMGWRGSEDTLHQVRLTFQTLEEALAYAEKMNLAVQIDSAHSRRARPKSYADNFRHDKVR
jgi:hypothetical protein